jgi:hypothetical protein
MDHQHCKENVYQFITNYLSQTEQPLTGLFQTLDVPVLILTSVSPKLHQDVTEWDD